MRILLDTCTLIWATVAPSVLNHKVQGIIADEDNEILVSAASAWEIATKVRLGKLPGAEHLERNYLKVIDTTGYTQLSIEPASALRAGRLTADHRDPFDRMIAAQALGMDIPIISPDAKLDQFGIRRIWD